MSDQVIDLTSPRPGTSLMPIFPEPPATTSAPTQHGLDHHPSWVLTLPRQLDLLRICVAHKHLYTERRGNNAYWRHVASEFDNPDWNLNRVRKYVQEKIRQYRADPRRVLNGQMKQLLQEIISQIVLVDATLPGLGPIRARPQRPRPRPRPSLALQPQHTIPGSYSVDTSQRPFTHSHPASTTHSDQELIEMSEGTAMQFDYDEARSRLLQISDQTVRDQRFEELDMARHTQIQINRELERQAKEAELNEDWETAKSLLSRIEGEEGPFLLLALEYSRRRPDWGLSESDEVMEQLKKKYPDPRLEQVELDENLENAKMTGNPQRIGHHRGLLRANKRKIGTLWEAPDDYRKVFQMMVQDMREASDKAWYGAPASPGEVEPRAQSESQPQRLGVAGGFRLQQRAQEQTEPQPDIDKELRLLDKARQELVKGYDKAKDILRQGSTKDSQEALKAVERGRWMMLADLEETETSLVAQADDVCEEWTPEDQMTLLLLMEEESRANIEKARSLLAPYSNSSQVRSLRKKIDQADAEKKRYFQECRDTLLAGGRLEDVEEEE
ncbi:unnamed protein product [Penicillium nalgiovense]|nr:unnamed protein product [Penicillium nalgiovense]